MDTRINVSKKVVHKASEFTGNKIADAVAKSKDNKIVKPKHIIDENTIKVEGIIILPEKREEILNQLRKYYKNGTLSSIEIIKWFKCIKICNKK